MGCDMPAQSCAGAEALGAAASLTEGAGPISAKANARMVCLARWGAGPQITRLSLGDPSPCRAGGAQRCSTLPPRLIQRRGERANFTPRLGRNRPGAKSRAGDFQMRPRRSVHAEPSALPAVVNGARHIALRYCILPQPIGWLQEASITQKSAPERLTSCWFCAPRKMRHIFPRRYYLAALICARQPDAHCLDKLKLACPPAPTFCPVVARHRNHVSPTGRLASCPGAEGRSPAPGRAVFAV